MNFLEAVIQAAAALATSDFARALKAAEEWAEKNGPELDKIHKNLKWFMEDGQSLLRQCAKQHGFVPPRFLPMRDLIILARDINANPSSADNAFRTTYTRLFARQETIESLRSEWAASKHVADRFKILTQALDAHSAGYWALTTPTLFAQMEGLIATYFGHTRELKGEKYKQYVAELIGKPDELPFSFNSVLNEFVTDEYLRRFYWGDDIPNFSRHAIIHGADTEYLTEYNSQRAIVLFDFVHHLCVEKSEEAKTKPGPQTSTL